MELGEGINPFSAICLGHPNTKDVLLLADRQASVESGGSVSLQDSVQFKTKDGRFPKSYLQASDKLWASLCILRIYLGDRHPLCVAAEAAASSSCRRVPDFPRSWSQTYILLLASLSP